jgi:hypothetical protein
MIDKKFPKSGLPIRKSIELLPQVFQSETNSKFLSGVLDPMIQPGVLEKLSGYIGKRYGKTYTSKDVYLDSDQTLRSRYQLEPGIVTKQKSGEITDFYDYIDFKNQLRFFGNKIENDNRLTEQTSYTWNPPICWDQFANFREYYWEPSGPPPVAVSGNSVGTNSTYRVSLGLGSSWIFSPDGFTNNPTITLYRGQTYVFKINASGNPFVIKTNYDTGSLLFDPNKTYFPGQIVLFDNKLWKAKVEVSPVDGSTINENSQDWQFIEKSSQAESLDYNKGITNNGIEVGDLIFEIPYDAPDVLFYQSRVDPDRLGRFLISNIDTNTFVDVEKEIIGKINYTSGNGIEFTNGLIVSFLGKTFPSFYQKDTWIVEGVGVSITLTRFSDLIAPAVESVLSEVLFDDQGFDTQPFDDAESFPLRKDYITISRNSKDFNPWSRYNRWFHRSVLEKSYKIRGRDFPADENLRAKRPIIEFKNDLQLFNHGSKAKKSIDFIDTFTTDIFSNISGSTGYNVDGEFLFDGARILVTADRDSQANNKIYVVKFIRHLGRNQIYLEESIDSVSIEGDCLLVKRGKQNSGKMFHFISVLNENGVNEKKWVKSQEKTAVNQPPLFDAYDEEGVSFSNLEKYVTSTFLGSTLLSYKIGNSIRDSELGFSLSYLNIDNIGDIQFIWNWEKDSFNYVSGTTTVNVLVSSGYYFFNNDKGFQNGWIEKDKTYSQILIDSTIIEKETNVVSSRIINWNEIESDDEYDIRFEVNGFNNKINFVREFNRFIFDENFKVGDVVTTKLRTSKTPNRGYYEIPGALEKNSLNNNIVEFTFGEASDHVSSALNFNKEFQGQFPGVSNLRDLEDYRKFGNRFLKHANISPLSVILLCDKKINVIKSIRYAAKSYSEIKNNIIKKSAELGFNENTADFLDEILNQINKVKSPSDSFFDSDMLGTGAYSSIVYKVDDEEIKTFSLSTKFNLLEPSSRAVYIYYNQQLLLNGQDYEFDENFGFVRIKISLLEGEEIEIREYNSTSYCFIPASPTKLGLYKKYQPRKFIDDTYNESREVIQGHDGSITLAFGDFRDDILLEFETRIYNNLKIYDFEKINRDVDNFLGNYYVNSGFSKDEVDQIISQDFLRWISNTGFNYSKNDFFDSQDSFTYTYSEMSDPTETISLPGYWRGVYKWFYDTDRPHRCPWEMLGFSEQPDWWEIEYGPTPYTNGNLILWEDLEKGLIKQGNRAGTHDRYKRPGLTTIIPVDDHGDLISPLDSGLARNFVLINNKGSFKFGDISPVEYAWRSSSDYPFSLVVAFSLLKPFDYIGKNFDKNTIKDNKIFQTVNRNTNKFLTIADLVSTDENSVGLIIYIKDYLKFIGLSEFELYQKIEEIDVNLSSRISGFVDKSQQKYLLDTKNPRSTSSGIFIPQENYEIFFDVSTPVETLTYSGVIIEKTETGWSLQGYDTIFPYFEYYKVIPTQNDPLISVGGVSAGFQNWSENKTYNNGQIVLYRGDYYRSLRTHDSGAEFDKNQWTRIPKLPIVGGVEALQRNTFNKFSLEKLGYGSELKTIQSVVDFLLGYEQFLIDKGFSFIRYDRELQVSRNWNTSVKEFMFWTRHNWAPGSLITLSPASQEIEIKYPVGVAENLLDSFYDYQVLQSDGTPIRPDLINVERDFQKTIVKIDENVTSDGIYFLKISYVLKEHIVVFDDKTVFNDIIYDETTGYRQERIKVLGFRTVDWDGDYTSPGFLFDNVTIDSWQAFKEYKLGDVVSYRSIFWVSQFNQTGTEFFNDELWSRLDSDPKKQLVPNFDYRINLFEDYYDVSASGIGQAQRDLARHSIGYQPRQYLENLSEDEVTQFQIYQGYIREKGTKNSISKIFDKLSRTDNKSSLEINEEWAFRVGRFGGIAQTNEIEIKLDKNKFLLGPQPIIYSLDIDLELSEKYYKVTKDDFSRSLNPLNDALFPVVNSYFPSLTAGYVNFNQVEFVLPSYSNFENLDIESLSENNHIWVTYDNNVSWNVYRFNRSQVLYIVSAIKEDTEVTVVFNRKHSFKADDFVGVKIINLFGFFKVISTTKDSVTFIVDVENKDPAFDESTINPVWILTPMRFSSYKNIDVSRAALLPNSSKIWIDQNEESLWEVVVKQKQFKSVQISNYGISTPISTGSKVLYDDVNKITITSIPKSGYVMTYYRTRTGLDLRQIIPAPAGLDDSVIGSFGEELAISPDSKWLFIGTPLANSVPSDYRGNFDPGASYIEGDVVIFSGILYRAKIDIIGDGSTITAATLDWEPANNIPAYGTANYSGYLNQGVVSVYEFVQQQWVLRQTFVSPRPEANENFGHSISIGIKNGEYIAAISAPGALGGVGRVYLYNFKNNQWNFSQNANYKGVYNPGVRLVARIFVQDGTPILEVDSINDQGRIDVGMTLNAVGVLPQTVIGDFIDGTRGGSGRYKINKLQTVSTTDFSATLFYPQGSVVWYDGNLWQNTQDIIGDSNEIPTDLSSWFKLADITTTGSLPKNIAIEDDGSTLAEGMLGELQIAELIKKEDRFGTKVAMDRSGDILAVGVPNSDGQFFINYRGVWKSDVEYIEGDVVKYNGSYHQLINDGSVPQDSTIRSYNQEPLSLPWENVGDSSSGSTGKIFIYERNNVDRYELRQTITTGNLDLYSDLESGLTINVGDQFGFSVDLDFSGKTMIVSSPKADINFKNQGSVYIFERDTASSILEYRLKQKLESFETNPNEYFGQDIKISPDTNKIIVGAKNSPYISYSSFDFSRTNFDNASTRFYESSGFAGGVYVFEKKDGIYFLTEKLEASLTPFESFGYSIDCTNELIVVGSPNYEIPSADHNIFKQGTVRLFEKDMGVKSWNILEKQQEFVDILKIKNIFVADSESSIKITDLDIVDPINFKILNVADKEIKFKTEYDPAIYNIGNSSAVVDESISWKEKHVGELWWDISLAKWVNYNQGDLSYKVSNWGRLAPGSAIRVCEWVETKLLPSEWSILADTTEGLALGISGQPLYPNDENYTEKIIFNSVTGEATETLYYYWVQNKSTLPENNNDRKISAADVAILIRDPASLGFAFAALIDKNSILAYNFNRLFRSDSLLFNLIYSFDSSRDNSIHNEYQIISENTIEGVIDPLIELKWIDSLVGADSIGSRVPEEKLLEKEKYGLSFRPRQTIFKDRIPILKDTILYLNSLLKQRPFSDQINFSILNSKEDPPVEILNLYDVAVETDIDLQNVGTVRVKQAKLSVNIVDGAVDTIDIIDSGFGYRVSPPVNISGDGIGAEAVCTLDSQGRIKTVQVINKGRKYSQALALIRPFSVLVKFDKTQENSWSIYSWDDVRRVFFRSRTQSFETSRFWRYVDWWKEGYSEKSRVVTEIEGFYQEPTKKIEIGDLIKISNYGSGGWAVLEKINDIDSEFSNNYSLVGRYLGTIELLSKIYDTTLSGIGFDGSKSFDTDLYDIENNKEVRNIFKTLKEDILVDDLKVEWKRLFFKSVRYALVEQPFVDWVFKTSFVNVKHNIGKLEKKLNFRNDNINAYFDYLNEVKPYKTTVRSFTTNYESFSENEVIISDFDLPSIFSTAANSIVTVDENSDLIEKYPWKWWTENNGYELIGIEIVNSGEGYTEPPSVVVLENSKISARAFISNGKVSKVLIEPSEENFKSTPKILLVGGTRSQNIARAVAILGKSKVRSFNISIKFDRITREGLISNFIKQEIIVAPGKTSSFDLRNPPRADKRNISISIRNNVKEDILLSSDYSITFYTVSIGGAEILRGRLILDQAPEKDDIIEINYEINDDLLDSVNRIQKYYSSDIGMKFLDTTQLMTGLDFGGVKIQGTTFDVTGGWDALPWFTDTWDSVSANADFYYAVTFDDAADSGKIYKPGAIIKVGNEIYVCKKRNIDNAGETIIPPESIDWEDFWDRFFVKLPFVPTDGQKINVYLKGSREFRDRSVLNLQYESEILESPIIRIDDPNFGINPDLITNPDALMPTIVGDGSTSIIDLSLYNLNLQKSDTLIFRPEESDGSITINDNNLLDTAISGGIWSTVSGSYSTATGLTAEEITIDGSNFISPDQVPAPEEVIPGQVLESLSIKVYSNATETAAPLESFVTLSDGTTKRFKINLRIFENESVIVYVDKIKKNINVDYEILWGSNSIEFFSAPLEGSLIEITSFGIGGLQILDVQEFVADGDTNLFLTGAYFNETVNVYVTVNGEFQDVQFVNSSDLVDVENRTLIRFGQNPVQLSVVKIICLGASFDTDSSLYNIVRVNSEEFVYDGSTRKFDLKNFVNLERGSSLPSVIVEVNGTVLRSIDTIFEIYNGTNNSFVLATDPFEPSGALLPANISVFINKQKKEFVQDYDYDGITKNLVIVRDILKIGDTIKIEHDFRTEFLIENNDLVIKSSVPLLENDKIRITWFSEYPSLDIVSDEFTGGKFSFRLKRIPLDISYVWVYYNGQRLVPDVDFYISGLNVYIRVNTVPADIIKIIQFGSEVYRNPVAFELYQDMFNVNYFKRYSITETKLIKELTYYDKELYVSNPDDLYDPSVNNRPGVLIINTERIMYYKKEGNRIYQLRRGVFGSAIAESHEVGSPVIDSGDQESIPYFEEQQRFDFVGDGSSLVIGPLPFIPVKTNKEGWYTESIPEEYGPCYEIEVFVAGKRLRKDPDEIFDESLGSFSPLADKKIEAEFSVDGFSASVRLTSSVPAGRRITIIRKIGSIWYDRKLTQISSQPLLDNTNKIAKFIAEKTTKLPE